MHLGAFFQQPPHHLQCGREANVVRIRLESQAQHRNVFSLHHPQRFVHFFQNAVDPLLVHAFSSLQNVEVHADRFRQVDERLNVFRETEAAEAQPGFEELRADARIEPHRLRYFFHVGADLFANVRDHVGVTDFQR